MEFLIDEDLEECYVVEDTIDSTPNEAPLVENCQIIMQDNSLSQSNKSFKESEMSENRGIKNNNETMEFNVDDIPEQKIEDMSEKIQEISEFQDCIIEYTREMTKRLEITKRFDFDILKLKLDHELNMFKIKLDNENMHLKKT